MSPEDVLRSVYAHLKKKHGQGEEKTISFQGSDFLVVQIRGSSGFFGINSREGGNYFHFCVWEGLPRQFFPLILFRLSVREFACAGGKACKSICIETKEGTGLDSSYTIDSPMYDFVEEKVRPLFHTLQKKILPARKRMVRKKILSGALGRGSANIGKLLKSAYADLQKDKELMRRLKT